MNKSILESKTIRTLSGIQVDVMNPTPEMFDINDIAHSLSHQCRFGGHTPQFFSVAQHSYNVSRKLPAKLAFTGLMHDAAEFVMLDMPRPIKVNLSNYKDIENGILEVMAKKFGFIFPFPDEIKQVDMEMLEFENKYLFESPANFELIPMSTPLAKLYFLEQYYKLLKNNPYHHE